MMYETLAAYYDALVKDDEATADWLMFVKTHIKGNTILEGACGSGEITLAMADAGYDVVAGDQSMEMMKRAQDKKGSEQITWQQFDLRDLSAFDMFDGIVCFCDSLNYLLELADLQTFFTQAYAHLTTNGVLLFDLHSMDRLKEFEEEYCEDGRIDETPYEWSIMSEDDYIYQNFAFYDVDARVHLEQHMQRVYDPSIVIEMLEKIGFQVEVFTDFTTPGIQEGEKQFFVCKKENRI